MGFKLSGDLNSMILKGSSLVEPPDRSLVFLELRKK